MHPKTNILLQLRYQIPNTTLRKMPEMNAYEQLLVISREEMKGLTSVFSYNKPSIPLKMNYENICIHQFTNGMGNSVSPLPLFNKIMRFARKMINLELGKFVTADSVTSTGPDSWRIQNGFVDIDICVHCYTEYDVSDFVFEDTAIHRVVVSMKANFDTKEMYSSKTHANEVFVGVNRFYAGMKKALTEDDSE